MYLDEGELERHAINEQWEGIREFEDGECLEDEAFCESCGEPWAIRFLEWKTDRYVCPECED